MIRKFLQSYVKCLEMIAKYTKLVDGTICK